VVAALPRVTFLGSKPMGLRCLAAMHETRASTIAGIVTIDDRADARNAFDALRCFGDRNGIPVTVIRSRADLHAAVSVLQPELAVVCGWYSMIPAATRAVATRGFIGVHNSLLPRYRGAAPIVWAMLHGEETVGLSMYTLTDGMDDGDVWARSSTAVGPDDYIGDVLKRLERACEDMIRRTFPGILDGSVAPSPQEAAAATYGAFRQPEDGRIRWGDSAAQVYRGIRAQSAPFPGAFTSLDGRRLTIWRAHPFEPPYYAQPGEVVRDGVGEAMVVCGDERALVIEQCQLDEGEVVAGRDVLRPRTVLGTDRR